MASRRVSWGSPRPGGSAAGGRQITNLADDATFFEKMIRAGVYTPEEARQVLDRLRA